MGSSIVTSFVVGTVLCLVQLLAALPWLAALDRPGFKAAVRKGSVWGIALACLLGTGAALAVFLNIVEDPAKLLVWGRPFGALLQAQLSVDFFVVVFGLLLTVWPKGAAVALSSFREGVRQPMFWLLVGFGALWIAVSPFIPYFTFGEDYKFVKELGYDSIMLLAVLFGVLNASMSISDEIEGRTAVTLMSKPVSRRQFLLGKFVGILMAALCMTLILSLCFDFVLWFKPWYDAEPLPDPVWLEPARTAWAGLGNTSLNFTLGALEWFDVVTAALPGLVIGFCQVMVLLAIAVALATRLPMIVNLVMCLLVFFLGNLAQTLVSASQNKYPLVGFIARFIENALPGLDLYQSAAIMAKDVPPPPGPFLIYVGSVTLQALLYTVIALLFGLILFEDRDLA